MSQPVLILGIGADGLDSLPPRARAAIAAAGAIAGGRRHLAMIGPTRARTFPIADNLAELVAWLREGPAGETKVVLASGDPLFYGIGHYLIGQLGADEVTVEPAISSLQQAFARARLAWHDADVASIHGRPLAPTLRPLLGRPKIGLFTRDGASPSEIAAFLIGRGLHDYRAWVCEHLGAADERIFEAPIRELVGRRFRDLNVVVLLREAGAAPLGGGPVPPDDWFARPDSGPVLLTHAETRAVTLARFHDLPEGPLWDIGAGLGGMAVGLARSFPGADILAVERKDDQIERLRANRERFGAWNLRIVAGEAPEALAGAEDPAGVFLGGSGGRLGPILDEVTARLRPGGVLVANFVGLEHLAACLDRLRAAGWPAELAQVQVSRGRPLAGLTALEPLRPVWIVRAARAPRPADG